MRTRKSIKFLFVAALILGVVPRLALAKGVETLKAGDAAPQEEAKPAADSAQQPAVEAKPGEEPKGETKPEEPKKEEPKKEERSEFSKSLDNKLYLGSSLGATTISGSKGDWSGGFANEVSAGYKLSLKVIEKLDLWGTVRYQPISATVIFEKQSYRARVSSWGIGAQGKYPVMPGMNGVVNAELALCSTVVESVDPFTKDDSLEGFGFKMTVGGGAEWTLLEKVLVGPRVNVGFGSYTTMELAATVGLLF